MSYCTNCGHKLTDPASFCVQCGQKIGQSEPVPVVVAPVVEPPVAPASVAVATVVEPPVAPAPVVAAPVVEPPVAPAPVVAAPVVEPPVAPAQVAKQKKKFPLGIVLAVILTAAICIGAMALIGNPFDSGSEASSKSLSSEEEKDEEDVIQEDVAEDVLAESDTVAGGDAAAADTATGSTSAATDSAVAADSSVAMDSTEESTTSTEAIQYSLDDPTVVSFNDEKMEALIRMALNKPQGDLTQGELNSINEIYIYGESYASLAYDISGMSWNDSFAFDLRFSDNREDLTDQPRGQLTDISDLSQLKNVTKVSITFNEVSDISVLSGLKSLTKLDLLGNNISDISVLSELKNLTELDLYDNNISNISALSEMKNLITLNLGANSITDISALSDMRNVQYLCLMNNSITDISALSNMRDIEELQLSNNDILDYSPLLEMEELEYLDIDWESVNLTAQECYHFGVMLANNGFESAATCFYQAVILDPDMAEAYIALADQYVEYGEVEVAIEVLEAGYTQTGSTDILAELERLQ